MSHQTEQQNAIEAVRQQNRREGKCEDCGGSGVVANMRAIDQTGDPHVNRPVVTATSGTCDRSMASGAMLSASDDLASLRAQVQALQQERDAQAAELREIHLLLIGSHITPTKMLAKAVAEVMERAEAAAAEIAQLREALRTYGNHQKRCAVRSITGHAFKACNCGFSAALTSAPEGTRP